MSNITDAGINITPRDEFAEPYDDGELPRPSWRPVDLTPVLDGRWTPPKPTVGSRTDSAGLFYPGKSHTVVSETEAGKTWFALSACQEEMLSGAHVLYVDFEDDEGSVAGRLSAMQTNAAVILQRFHYVRPDAPLVGRHISDLEQILGDLRPTLVVVDGITEGMALHQLDPNKNDDAAKFGRMLTKRITDAGAAAVSLDHVVKDREGRGRYALGAVHKINGLTGAQYTLANRHPFGVGITGRSTLSIAKDRPGQLRANALPSAGGLHWYGDLVMTSHEATFVEVTVEPPEQRAEDFKPTRYMQRIADALTEHGELSKRVISDVVTGKTDTLRTALSHLIAEGYVTDSTPHRLLKPYHPGGES